MTKNPSIDLIKGLLILLVMGGHAMELADRHHIALWIGSGFRMPLMMGISGYLLNVTRTRTEAVGTLFNRYGARLLLPWLVAMIVYLLAGGFPIGWTTPVDLLLRPPFHLWYIPALFLLILAARLIPVSPLMLLAIGAPISLTTMYSFGLDHGPVGQSLLSPDSRLLRYPIYFFFGMVMAERGLPRRYLWPVLMVATAGLWWWAKLYDGGHPLALVPARLMMCLGLLSLLPLLSTARIAFAPINHMGRNSLFFYLWHPLIMGVVLTTGVGAGMTLGLSIATLFGFSRLLAPAPFLRTLAGSVPDERSSRFCLTPASLPAAG